MPDKLLAPTFFPALLCKKINLEGLSVSLGQPIQLTAQLGWKVGWPNYEWEHAFHSPDSHDGEVPQGGVDRHVHAGFRYSVESGICQRLPDFEKRWRALGTALQHADAAHQRDLRAQAQRFPDGATLELFEQTPGDEHNFTGPYYLFPSAAASAWSSCPTACV